MISSAQIKKKATSSYASFLASLITNDNIFPLEIRGNKSPGKTLETYRKEMDDLMSSSKTKKKHAYTIDCVKTKTRFIGSQSLPKRIYFASEQDYVGYLNKINEVKKFKEAQRITLLNFPQLKDWLVNNTLKVITNIEKWDDVLKVVSYFDSSPNPNLYIRELPIKVHTKFIEKNKSIIWELLNIVVAESLNKDEKKHFESRFNLKYSEPLVRFRLLETRIAQDYFSGLEDVTIKISDFSKLDLSVKKVLIVENLMNLLTLPHMSNTMAIFGQGFKVLSLKNINWLKECQIYYWGDLDAQGFEILSGFRGHYQQTKSLMMDKTTFDLFYEDDLESKSKIETLVHLNEEEHTMHQLLFRNKWRLEQEKIPMDYTLSQLKKLTQTT